MATQFWTGHFLSNDTHREVRAMRRQDRMELLQQLGQVLQQRGWVRSHRPEVMPRVVGSFEWPPSRPHAGGDATAISIIDGRVEVFLADAPHVSSYHRVFDRIDVLDSDLLTQIEAYRCPPALPGLPEGFAPDSSRPRTLAYIASEEAESCRARGSERR